VESLKKKEKRARRSGTGTIAYLKEKSAKEFQIRQEELQIRKEEQCAQAKRQEQMTRQVIQQQEHQQDMFANLQQQKKSAATVIKRDANGYDATTTVAKPGSHSSTAAVCQEEVYSSPE